MTASSRQDFAEPQASAVLYHQGQGLKKGITRGKGLKKGEANRRYLRFRYHAATVDVNHSSHTLRGEASPFLHRWPPKFLGRAVGPEGGVRAPAPRTHAAYIVSYTIYIHEDIPQKRTTKKAQDISFKA